MTNMTNEAFNRLGVIDAENRGIVDLERHGFIIQEHPETEDENEPPQSTGLCAKTIIETARRALGAKFLHQGRNPETGIDCVGLLVWSGRQLGLSVHDNRRYAGAGIMRRLIEAEVSKTFKKVPNSAILKPGDILLQLPSHAAILTKTDPLTIIEAHTDYGVVEHSIDRCWMDRVFAIYRFPNQEVIA
jgi:cell wall-associated NlpC family hydrolase